jgi:Uma2 family endonuclease
MSDYTTYETDELYEIWEGEKIMMSPSSPKHESIVGNLYFLIKGFVFEKKLGALYLSNIAIHLKEYPHSKDFQMPDISFVSNHNKQIVKENGIFGVPDLVVEVVSPGIRNTRRDTIDKFQLYEQAGVVEYWLVDPIGLEIEIYTLVNKKYIQVEESIVLKGVVLSQDLIFADDFSS